MMAAGCYTKDMNKTFYFVYETWDGEKIFNELLKKVGHIYFDIIKTEYDYNKNFKVSIAKITIKNYHDRGIYQMVKEGKHGYPSA